MPRRKSSAPISKVRPTAVRESAAPGAALLVVDMQDKLLAMFSAEEARALRARVSLAIAAAHGLGLPVFFSEQVPAKLGATGADLLALAPGATVHAKDTFSALGCEPLREALGEAGVEHLLIAGIETPVCIYQTALGALGEGWQATVLTDAIAARRAPDQAACLASLRAGGVHLLPVETVFYALLHGAGHPYFRAFTSLVKTYG